VAGLFWPYNSDSFLVVYSNVDFQQLTDEIIYNYAIQVDLSTCIYTNQVSQCLGRASKEADLSSTWTAISILMTSQ
jgi:hypothetical protein